MATKRELNKLRGDMVINHLKALGYPYKRIGRVFCNTREWNQGFWEIGQWASFQMDIMDKTDDWVISRAEFFMQPMFKGEQ